MKTKKMLFLSLMVAQSLLLFLLESLIPIPFVAPGAKIGLSNIITVICLYILSFKDTFIVIILKIFLSTLFGGTLSSLLYSLFGGLLSLISMYIVKKTFKDKISILGVSIVGSIFHNIGQLIAASLVVQSFNIFVYFPVLMIAGLIAGILVGVVSKYLLIQFEKIGFIKKLKDM